MTKKTRLGRPPIDKQGRARQLNVYLPVGHFKKLSKIADDECNTISGVARLAIKEFLENRE